MEKNTTDFLSGKNIDELLTSYIDNEELDDLTRKHVEELISYDVLSFRLYKSEKLVKEFFASRLKQKELPKGLYSKINASIEELSGSTSAKFIPDSQSLVSHHSYIEHLKEFFVTPFSIGVYAVPRYTFAVILFFFVLGLALVLNNNKREINTFYASGSEKSIMVQAVNNFHKILTGEIKPTINSTDTQEIKKIIATESNFDAFIPDIQEYRLIGAVTNDFNGKKIAHFVYSSGDELIYIYETVIDSLCHKKLELPSEMHNQILKDKFYLCDKFDDRDCAFMMWYKNNILCASVSNLPKQKMYTTLATYYK